MSLPRQIGRVDGRAASETGKRHFEHSTVSGRWVEAGGALLDLTDEHVGAIGRTSKRWVRLERALTNRPTPVAADDLVTGASEAHGEDVQIGH